MRRHARIVHRSRMRLENLERHLRSQPPAEWPKHLRLAWGILQSKRSLSETSSMHIILGSASAAHECAREINRRAASQFEAHTRNKLYKAFVRVANCVQRAPERLRQGLDQAVLPIVQQDPIDLEVIEAILDATASAFLQYCDEESAKTALKALGVSDVDGIRRIGAKVDFSGLDTACRCEVEAGLSNQTKLPGSRLNTSNVFETMAAALDAVEIQGDEIATLITDYVADVASRWREAGIKPSRARHPEDLKYKSSFHKFVELVITAILEPDSLRHDGGLEERAQAIRRRHAELPHDSRSIASPSLRRSDVEWIVSDDHLKKALVRRLQKTGPDTP
jgi:hypothetical protein